MSQRYKIALVMLGKDETGGVSSVCWFLYQMISSVERYDVHLFSLETTYNNPNNMRLLSPKSWFRDVQIIEYTWHNFPAIHVSTRFSELEYQRYMPRRPLTDLLDQFDLVQVVSGGPAIANVTRNIAKPVCLFIATLMGLERKSILQKATFLRKVYGHMMLPIISRVEKQALHRVDHVFAETEYTRQAILPYVDSSKITIDTIGVDTHKFQPIPEKKRTNDYILSVGRFEDARKNIVLLFEAYALLRQRMPEAPKLILAGKTGPSPAAWVKARTLGIMENIIFKKGVSIDELVTLYQNAAAYVLSSDEEGLGIVLLEAMACATPVISTCCGGPDSVVSDQTGFLTPVGDAKALSERMLWILENPEQQRKMGQAGRRMVETRFSNEVVGKKYLEVYDKLLQVEMS
jgi:glycosyltransferase involved in cell wall biosynthesis